MPTCFCPWTLNLHIAIVLLHLRVHYSVEIKRYESHIRISGCPADPHTSPKVRRFVYMYILHIPLYIVFKLQINKKQQKLCYASFGRFIYFLGLNSSLSFPYLRAGLSKNGAGVRCCWYTPGLPALVTNLGLIRALNSGQPRPGKLLL